MTLTPEEQELVDAAREWKKDRETTIDILVGVQYALMRLGWKRDCTFVEFIDSLGERIQRVESLLTANQLASVMNKILKPSRREVMPCTNSTATVSLVNGGPVVVLPSEVRFNSFAASLQPLTCNTGAGACGQTGQGNATFDPVEIERIGSAIQTDIHVSVYLCTNPSLIGDYALANANIVGTMAGVGESVQTTLNIPLNEGEVAVLLVWYLAYLNGTPVASVVAIAAALAGQCT